MSSSISSTVTPCSSAGSAAGVRPEALVGVEPRRGSFEQDQPGLAGERPADTHQLALTE